MKKLFVVDCGLLLSYLSGCFDAYLPYRYKVWKFSSRNMALPHGAVDDGVCGSTHCQAMAYFEEEAVSW